MTAPHEQTARRLVAEVGQWISDPSHLLKDRTCLDNDVFLGYAEKNRLAPWLGARAMQEGSGATIRRFRKAYQRNLLMAYNRLQAVEVLQACLSGEDIHPVMMRGVFSGQRYYGDMGLRLSEDVDLLIPLSARDRALDLLLRSGYDWMDEGRPASFYRRHAQHWPLCDALSHERMEVHWRLDHPFYLYQFDHDGILERAEWVEHEGVRWREAEWHDNLLMIFAHVDKHARAAKIDPLMRVEDVLWLVEQGILYWWMDGALALERQEGRLNPGLLMDRARQQGLLEIVGIGLQSICNIWGGGKACAFLKDINPCCSISSRTMGGGLRIPIRCGKGSGIDYWAFLFPPSAYFPARAGVSLWLVRARHFIRGVVRVMVSVLDVWGLCAAHGLRIFPRLRAEHATLCQAEGCAR